MKFHRVKVENLNSLYGVQTIDFEDDVRNSALFLILGPTGAGKSTILDAICLALFGQTPRLSRRTSRPDTDIAHIMSIGTAHACAEVEFSTLQPDGSRTRYLACWSARRAYDDPEGALQKPERSLYRKLPDGSLRLVVSDHREKYFQPGFDDALQGLSVEDFKRSILLAQGEFAAFLHATDSDKASILERLTSTEQYRRIGERAARRRRVIDERHRELMTRIEEMQILTVPQEEELAAAIAQATAAREAAREAVDLASRRVDWVQTLEALEDAQTSAAEAEEAARAAAAERTEDRARLERDAALLEVEPAWREVERAAAARAETIAKLEPLHVELTRLAELEEPVERAVTAAQLTLQQRLAEAERLEPALRRAHDLRTRLQAAAGEAKTADAALVTAQTRLRQIDADIDALTPRQDAAAARLADARQRRGELANARPLLESYATQLTRFETGIVPLRERLASLQLECEQVATELAELATERARFDDDVAAARKERSKWQGQVTRAENRLGAAIGSHANVQRAVAALAAELDAATTRAEALREARYLLLRIREQEAERDALYTRLEAAHAEVAALRQDEEQLKALETAHRATVRASEEALRMSERVIALSAYRRELEFGHPCPLCGSAAHPYCESGELDDVDAQAAEDRRRLETELGSAREVLRTTNEKVQMLAAKFVARKTALGKDEARSLALRESLEADHAAFSRSAEKAAYSPLEAFRLKNEALLDADLAAAVATTQTTRTQLDEIEQARQQLDAAEAKLAEANQALTAVDEQLATRDERKRQLEERLDTRRHDRDAHAADEARRAASLIAELAAFVPRLPSDATVEEALEAARTTRDAVSAADRTMSDAQASVDQLQVEATRLAELRGHAQTSVDDATALAHNRRAAVVALEAEIRDCLEGRNPDEVKRDLDAALAEARASLDAAQQERAAHNERLSAARARSEELDGLRAQAAAALEEAGGELDATLARLELTRDDVAASLLTPAARKALTADLQRLDAQVARAADRHRDAQLRLERHNAVPLAAPAETLAEITEQLTGAREHLDRVTRELGALGERWARHEETRSRRAQFEEELRAVQHELDIWTTIYGVIGIRDGERFKLFAQSLNLQGLVDNANVRLQKLHARYELSVARGEGGEPTLGFLVRDKYQANVERPLTTLSGGETFLVSLALALGLADFRRVDMPIETLLLDEGFGALDQDSLHMALTTLHQLHRDGTRQIGIISHVDALKELIDARIVVEPRGHGRSRIRFEFGTEQSGPPFELIHG